MHFHNGVERIKRSNWRGPLKNRVSDRRWLPHLPYLAGENKTEKDRDGELTVTEEDYVEQVWVGRMLQKEPGRE